MTEGSEVRYIVTPAKAGVHGAAGSVVGFEDTALLTGFTRSRE
jgi:hypothetical protein